tara:strand:- start:62 stop:694 length:633 start_codon:yes stop_codon:yes gene_type:complete
MKKNLATLALILASANAQASNYIGMEVQSNKLGYSNKSIEGININAGDYYKDSATNLTLVFGHKIEKDLALEFNYSRIQTDKSNNSTGLYHTTTLEELTASTKANYNLVDFDLVKSYNIANNFNLFALAGLKAGQAKFKENFNFLPSNSVTKYGYGINAGFGASYAITKEFEVRAKVRYSLLTGFDSSKIYGHDGLDNMLTFAAGVNYKF